MTENSILEIYTYYIKVDVSKQTPNEFSELNIIFWNEIDVTVDSVYRLAFWIKITQQIGYTINILYLEMTLCRELYGQWNVYLWQCHNIKLKCYTMFQIVLISMISTHNEYIHLKCPSNTTTTKTTSLLPLNIIYPNLTKQKLHWKYALNTTSLMLCNANNKIPIDI